jgi:hypothetical protein
VSAGPAFADGHCQQISIGLERTAMNETMDYSLDNSNAILPSQYSDLIRRRSLALDGEHRLMWAVLEDAIRSYLANQACATAKQQHAFAEVNAWFHAAADEPGGLFTFETICEFLAIDSAKLVKRLRCIRGKAAHLATTSSPACRRFAKPRRLAA